MDRGRLGQAKPRRDAQVGYVMLQYDQHDRRQRDHPQQRVTVLSPGGQIRRPVAGVDEADGHEQSRPDVFEYLQSARDGMVLTAVEKPPDPMSHSPDRLLTKRIARETAASDHARLFPACSTMGCG